MVNLSILTLSNGNSQNTLALREMRCSAPKQISLKNDPVLKVLSYHNLLTIKIYQESSSMQPETTVPSIQTISKFPIFLESKAQSTLSIDQKQIVVGDDHIQLSDAIGLIKDSVQSTKSLQLYRLYSFPRQKKFLRSPHRYIERTKFWVKNTSQWEVVKSLIILRITNRTVEQSLKLLICFNPNAGANSQKHLDKILEFIQKTNLEPILFRTQYRNHCLEHLKTVDPTKYCGVAIVSGDGLMHEYVNSFCCLPVTHVPAGSGNAFAKTQMEIAGEQCKDEESIFLVVKNRKKQFNIVKYELEKIQMPIFSFLALEWAIIADLDLNSESLRFLGGLRFEIFGALRVLKMKRYRARITYSTTAQTLPPLSSSIPESNEYKTLTDSFLHAIFCTIPYISDKYKIAPSVKVEEALLDLQLLKQESGRLQLIKYLLGSDSGSHFNTQSQTPAEGFDYMHSKVKCFRLEPLDPENMGVFGIDGEMYESQRIQATFHDQTFEAFV